MPPAYFLHAPTPHIGAATVEAQKRIGQEIVEIIAALSPGSAAPSPGPCFLPSASPRGIAAVVGAKNMPPAYFLHAPTPHIGAATVEAQKRIGQEIVEIIAAM